MPLISDSIGRVLGKRYRLVSALGTGASAHVFLAEDVSLQRRVAVKVLQPALAHDASFLRRFEREARAVASLNHPHILRVFDWGEDEGGPYLVLEYLHGGSLRDVLHHGVLLSHAQAARLGVQAAQGLAYAHARGLVHRDIKPANLLLDEEGRVRIADFGVARALAETALTEPAGAMIGTARYTSPEQAQGRSVDGRADVYALGLVLYESITGEVPFVADTTVGTLMARVGAPLPPHPSLGPLGEVLARAAAPDVSDRLDAAGLAGLLERVAASMPPPDPLPLLAPSGGEPTLGPWPSGIRAAQDETSGFPGGGDWPTRLADGDRTLAYGDVGATDTTLLAGTGSAGSSVPAAGGRGGPGEVFDIDALEGGPPTDFSPARRAPSLPPPPRARRRRSRWPWAVGVVLMAIAVGVALLVAADRQLFTPSHTVPALSGKTVAAARQLAAADHFTLSVGRPVHSISAPVVGSIISQRPAPGVSRKEGSVIYAVPSAGLPSEKIPPLAGLGLDCTGAGKLLAADHFKELCPALSVYTSTVPTGQIINWSYDKALNPTAAPYGSTISIAISKGKPPVAIPKVAGDASFTQAQSTLEQVGLQATQVQGPSTTVPDGQVVGTTPTAGTIATVGSTVKVDVSTGPPVVTVPGLNGDSVQTATTALQAAGLVLGQVYGPPAGHVFTTNPPSGQQVRRGSTVSLYTRK